MTSFGKRKPDNNAWLVTYSDTITLLMAFFVLLLSLSTLDQSKVEQFEEGISAVLLKKTAKKPFANLSDRIQQMLNEQGLQNAISVHTDPLGIQLDFASSVLYQSGSADIKPEMLPTLEKVADIIKAFSAQGYQIKVEGHTDDVPIQTDQFPSNWELSASRATVIVRHLMSFGIDKAHMMAIGLADARPLAPNRDKQGYPIIDNQAKNRRVSVSIHRL